MKKELNLEVGKNIRLERERAHLTREELAELIEVTPRFIADVESGRVGVSISTLKKTCEALNISSDCLLWSKTTNTSIDEKLEFVEEDYIHYIDHMVQTQLELISYIKQKEKSRNA